MGNKVKKVRLEKLNSFMPLGDRVVIKRLDDGKFSEGGLHIPDSAQEERRLAKVVAVGPGKYQFGQFVPTTVKPGDFVLVAHYAGVAVECGNEKLEFINEEQHCFAVVEPAEE